MLNFGTISRRYVLACFVASSTETWCDLAYSRTASTTSREPKTSSSMCACRRLSLNRSTWIFRRRCSRRAWRFASTAAAEYRRVTTGASDGFAQVEQLPKFLGGAPNGESNLLNLFPPTKNTRRLFAVPAAFLGDRSKVAKGLRAFAALLAVWPLL